MLIIVSSKIKPEKLLRAAIKGSWLLTAFFCLLFAVFTTISFYNDQAVEHSAKKDTLGCPRSHSLSLEKIGQGPLSLNSSKKKTLLPDMSQEIILLAKNIRPDRKAKETSFLLFLRSSKAEYKVKNGDVVFLSCDPQPGGATYRFSERKTPLWLRPTFLDKNKVLIEVGLFMPSKESEGFLEEKAQFVLQEDFAGSDERFQSEVWFSSLRKAKFWGIDVILSKYREKPYVDLDKKPKIEIPGSKGTIFCFMQQGDFLAWNGDSWVPIENGGKAAGRPLAQVKTISQREVEFEVWNEEGFYPQWIKLETQGMGRSAALKPDQLPQSVRMRTSRQISCSFAKRRYLLKPGDWVLKTSRGWKVLKRPIDMEEYLHHKIRGELCVFDALVREQGKLMMKGYWVDEMRTHTSPFSIPVEGDHAFQKAARKDKKRFTLKKAEGVTTYLPFFPQQEKGEGIYE